MMGLDVRMNLADDLLLYTDKITMWHSLECRVPLLDLGLVRFIETLPANYRVRLRQGKIIHKALAEKTLPEKIVHRPKKGFISPTSKWFKKTAILRDLLLDKNAAFASFIDLHQVRKVIDKHVSGYNRERHIFLLLCIKFILEKEKENFPR